MGQPHRVWWHRPVVVTMSRTSGGAGVSKKVELARSFQQRHDDKLRTSEIRQVAPVQRDMVCTSGYVTSMVTNIDFDLEANFLNLFFALLPYLALSPSVSG